MEHGGPILTDPQRRRRLLPGGTSLFLGLVVLVIAAWALWERVPSAPDPAPDLAEVVVDDLDAHSERGAHLLVLRETGGRRRLTMVIGDAEAQAIANEQAGRRPPRPGTHDLLWATVRALDAQVVRVEIVRLEAGTYFARIVLRRGQRVLEVDARPSDAIALALRGGASIYVHRSLFDSDRPRTPSTKV